MLRCLVVGFYLHTYLLPLEVDLPEVEMRSHKGVVGLPTLLVVVENVQA